MHVTSSALFYFTLGVIAVNKVKTGHIPGRGFGDHIKWYSLNRGLAEARSKGLPVMLVVHKSWCGACSALKPKFASHTEIASLSQQFIMVNAENDEEPKEADFSPDGGYIPRILFLSPDGTVRKEFYNTRGNPSYKYFYSDPNNIAAVMKHVLKEFDSDTSIPKKEGDL